MSPAQAAVLMRVLSTRKRLEIMSLLVAHDEALTTSFVAAQLNQPDGQASANLMKLSDCGLLMRSQAGTNRFYTPNRQMLKELMSYFEKPQGETKDV